MKKTLSISVMAHPSRAKYFSYLNRMLGDVPFSIDEKSEGPWANAKKAWAMHDPKAEYHAVIQDDAIICENFRARAEQLIRKHRDEHMAFSFYYGRRAENAKHARMGLINGFVISNWLSWGVAACLPVKKIPQMIQYCEKFRIKNDDTRIANYLKFHDLKIFYPIPSLIDHRFEEKSLVGDAGGRRAWYFIDNEEENKRAIQKIRGNV